MLCKSASLKHSVISHPSPPWHCDTGRRRASSKSKMRKTSWPWHTLTQCEPVSLPCKLRSSRLKISSLLASAVMLVTDSDKTEETHEP